MHHLRIYERTAQDAHFCDYCLHEIAPGDTYQGEVFVSPERKQYRILVLKRHIYPPCPDNPDEEFWKDKESFNPLEIGLSQSNEISKAA